MNKKILLTTLSILSSVFLYAQFPGAADTEGSTAIHKDSSIITAWASGCSVERGFVNISKPELGLASAGESSNAIGKADGISIVSLGDSGIATLTFDLPIRNGEGYDFAVFENSFSDTFLELAFVEVSSDGVNFFRFPATSNTPTETQTGGFGNTDPTLINNLAGKYKAHYGTPFDLEELKGIEDLDIDAITHVKIIDVVGSIDPEYATYDINGNPVNDPFPTPFESSGFDLDAVAVIHQKVPTSIQNKTKESFSIYPNPAPIGQKLHIQSDTDVKGMSVYGQNGKLYYSGQISQFETHYLSAGIYFIQVGNNFQKIVLY